MKTRNFMSLLAMSSLLAFAPSCSNDDDDVVVDNLQPIPLECNVVQQTDYAAKSNKFAGKFYGTVAADGEFAGENFCVSPISMQYLVSMLANGADDEAAVQQISDVFEFGTLDNINTNSKLLLDKLDEDDEFVKTDINNSLWADLSCNLTPMFKQTMETYYDAEVGSLDFNNNPAKAKATINKWASDETNGMIKNLSLAVNNNTRFVLLSALYFNGKWSTPFKTNLTKDEPFYNLDSTKVGVSMMNRAGAYVNQYADDELQAVELPYGKGYYTMTIVMPKNSATIDSLAQNLDWWQLHEKMTELNLELGLPKFKTTSNFRDLKKCLPLLGLDKLSGVSYQKVGLTPDIRLSQFTQDVVIEVEENGTQAAATSGAGVEYTAPSLPKELVFNHPFIYTIRENTTGTILFMGRVVKF